MINLLMHEERTLVQVKGIPPVGVGDASAAGIASLERFHRRGMSRIGPKDYCHVPTNSLSKMMVAGDRCRRVILSPSGLGR